jgi:hypothetical protein
MVGFIFVLLQQTPFWRISPPPAEVIFPPPTAVVEVIEWIWVVVNAGGDEVVN